MKEVLSRHGSLVNQDNGSAVTFGLVLVISVTVRRERSVVPDQVPVNVLAESSIQESFYRPVHD